MDAEKISQLMGKARASYRGLQGAAFELDELTDAFFNLGSPELGIDLATVCLSREVLRRVTRDAVILQTGEVGCNTWEEWKAKIAEDPEAAKDFEALKMNLIEPLYHYLLANLPEKLNAAVASFVLEGMEAIHASFATSPEFADMQLPSKPPSKIAQAVARMESRGAQARIEPLTSDRRKRPNPKRKTEQDLLDAIQRAKASGNIADDSLFTYGGFAGALLVSETAIRNLMEREKLGRPEDLRKLFDDSGTP
jgi:hypothetical protein